MEEADLISEALLKVEFMIFEKKLKDIKKEEIKRKKMKYPERSIEQESILDKDLNPICIYEWCNLSSDFGYVMIGKTNVNGWHISTIWTGITTQKTPFETIIFDRKGNPSQIVRHSSEEEAEKFHLTMVKTYLSLPEYEITNT